LIAERLVEIAWSLGHWAYAFVFVVAALEASAFIGLVVPGETLTVAAGFLASAGALDLAPTIVAAALGAIAGDSIGYEMGRRLGRAWLVRHGARFGFGESRLARIEARFARYGGATIFLARFVGFVRAFAPFVAGAARMPYRQFLFFNVAGAGAWACVFVLVGYFVGESWWIAERWVGRVGLIAAVVVIAAALFWLLRLRRAKTVVPRR
jgi:undecaprenyl-diphosphatase